MRKVVVVKKKQKQLIPFVWTGEEAEVDYSITLAGRGAEAILLLLLFGKENQTLTLKTDIYHQGQDSKSRVVVKGALNGKSKVDFEGTIKIDKGARGSKAWLAAHLLLFDNASGRAVPNMEIAENEVVAGHAVTVSRINDLEPFYLMSRGLSKELATKLVIQGFLQSIVKEFPEEDARRARKKLGWA